VAFLLAVGGVGRIWLPLAMRGAARRRAKS
jgi:hypothetical protein